MSEQLKTKQESTETCEHIIKSRQIKQYQCPGCKAWYFSESAAQRCCGGNKSLGVLSVVVAPKRIMDKAGNSSEEPVTAKVLVKPYDANILCDKLVIKLEDGNIRFAMVGKDDSVSRKDLLHMIKNWSEKMLRQVSKVLQESKAGK